MTGLGIGIRPRSAEYADVQRRLARGWNTWDTRSVLTQARLPDGLAIALAVKEYYRGLTLRSAQIGRHGEFDERITLGPHAIDGGYTDVTVEWLGIRLRVRTAHDGGDLVALIEPLETGSSTPVLAVAGFFAWGAPGVVERDGDLLRAESSAGETLVRVVGDQVEDPYVDVDGPRLLVRLDRPVGVCTGAARDLEAIRTTVENASAALDAATVDEHDAIVRDSVAWNTVWEPKRERVVTTVSRLWNTVKRGGFAMFCWDAFFGALLSGWVSRDLAHANAVEMLREAVSAGFVPNVSQGTGRKTFDGSQPPVGAIVCWQLYRRFGERWFLEEVLAPLVEWNRWWWRSRRNGDLLSAGTTVFTPDRPSPQDLPRIGQHFGATCESGLDGHPVFSDVPLDESTGLLAAHDIGLNSEYVADCEAIAAIARELGETAIEEEMTERGTAVADAVRARLWDRTSGIYRNHLLDGTPTAYVAPTSFYPMYAGISDRDQAREMTERHLLPDTRFGGTWPLPSFPHDEVHEKLNPYWRDRVWPPMNFLVYLGLRRAGETDAASALAERCGALVLGEWQAHRHIHENYSSVSGMACEFDNSQPYLTWGALLSLAVLVEAGDADIDLGAV